MLTEVVGVPFNVAENTPPVEVEDRLTVSAAVVGLPLLSCSWTVNGPSLAVVDVKPPTEPAVKTNLAGVPAVMLKALALATPDSPVLVEAVSL